MVKRIISVLGIFVILFSNCLSVHADIVDSGSYIASNFWDFLSGNEYDYNLDFWKNVTGYFVGKECPSSPDSYHHGPKPAFGSSSGGSDENGRFGWATCEYCGNPFKVYSSFTPNSSGFGSKSDLQQSYEAQVAELPATGYQSNGALRWSPKTLYMSFDTGLYSRAWAYCPDYPGTVKTSSAHNFSFDCDNKSFSIRPSSESTYFYLVEIRLGFDGFFPIDGFYKIIESSAFMQSAVDDNSVLRPGVAFYRAESSGVYHNSGESFFASSSLEAVGSNRYKIFSAQCYPPVYEITPYDSLIGEINTTYNINSRPTSITGDYGIIGDNGQIIKVEGDKIVNETNNTIYNPATGETHILSDWSYNYTDRSYTVTTETGDTITVTYGDENVTIKEGDTTYNIYYLVDGSGSETPGPEVCDHDWAEDSTIRPTCSTPGKVTMTCSKCGQTKTETLPALGHNWTVDRTVQTSYDEQGNLVQQGYTIYKCSVCGEQYKDSEGTGPPGTPGGSGPGSSGGDGEKSIWEKIGEFFGTIGGGFLEIIGAVAGKLLDALTKLAEMLLGKLKTVVETILTIFDEVPALFGGFLDFLGAVFPFLPPEITTILTFGVIAITFIGILKAVRR